MANEKRLIDANALLKIYKNWLPQLTDPEDKGDRRGVETCIAVLKDAPTVDAVEVVHGNWIDRVDNDTPMHECSICGARVVKGLYEYENPNRYCYHCGAKMDGGNEDG